MSKTTMQFNETAASSYNAWNLRLTVIKPGVSKNNRNYPAEMLRRDCQVFAEAQMFSDHQTEAQRRAMPENSISNWVGSITRVWCEADGTVKATAKVIDPAFKLKLENLKSAGLLSQMGVSIRCAGEVKDSTASPVLVESLTDCRSVDFVTRAGAGGQIEAMESFTGEIAGPKKTTAQLQAEFDQMDASQSTAHLTEAQMIVFESYRKLGMRKHSAIRIAESGI
jgi:hypothetical protein